MQNDTLQTDLSPILGLDALNEEERAVFLADVGALIIEASLLRLVAGLTADQEASLNHYLETDPAPEVLMDYLIKHHKDFEKIIDEEVAAFREEAIAVLGKGALEEAALTSAIK